MINRNLAAAYDRLYHSTPLGFYNCGRLCDGLCCRGDEMGMWLFPGEEVLFKDKEGFEICETEGNYGYPMVVCSGACNRKDRPLACRIYPLFPIVTEENGKVNIDVIRDPRATMCPIFSSAKHIDSRFIKDIRMAVRYLIRDPETFEYLKAVSSELLDIIELRKKLGLY